MKYWVLLVAWLFSTTAAFAMGATCSTGALHCITITGAKPGHHYHIKTMYSSWFSTHISMSCVGNGDVIALNAADVEGLLSPLDMAWHWKENVNVQFAVCQNMAGYACRFFASDTVSLVISNGAYVVSPKDYTLDLHGQV